MNPASEAMAYVGVGSSLFPRKNIPRALRLLAAAPGAVLTRISTFYRTPPLPAPGTDPATVAEDPDFYNGVLELRTTLPPQHLRKLLSRIEEGLGRVREEDRYAPRVMDLDLLFHTDDPEVLHEDVRRRPWVAIPLGELAPELPLPPDGAPALKVGRAFSDPGGEVELELTHLLRSTLLSEDFPV